MKVLIKSRVVLTGIRVGYFPEFTDFLKRNSVPYKFTEAYDDKDEKEFTYKIYLNDNNDPTVCVNLSEEDMKIFLNTVERHSRKRIQFEYLGNMRFDLILGN